MISLLAPGGDVVDFCRHIASGLCVKLLLGESCPPSDGALAEKLTAGEAQRWGL